MYVLNGTKELKPGQTWIDDNGVQHPGNWASVWSDDVKASYGIKEVTIQTKPDNKFYWVGQKNLDGSWNSKPKNIDDVTITNDNGEKITTLGLKSQWIAKIKETANTLLAPTDWQVIAKAERDRAIDSNVATYRAAVITKCAAIETAITNAADFDAFKALFDAPTKTTTKTMTNGDGSTYEETTVEITGNVPIHDWPEE